MDRFRGTSVLRLSAPAGGTLSAWAARRPRERLLGLAWLPFLPAGSALLIPRCRAVHTFGMRFALDVVFVAARDRGLEVVELRLSVPRRRVVIASRAGVDALELPAGGAQRLALTAGLRLTELAPFCDADYAW